MMDLIDQFFSALGVSGVIALTAAIFLLLMTIFFCRNRLRSQQSRQAQSDITEDYVNAPINAELDGNAPPDDDMVWVEMQKELPQNLDQVAKEAESELPEIDVEVDFTDVEQEILDKALKQAYQNPDAPSGFGASSLPPRPAPLVTFPDPVAAPPIEEEETEIAIPQIIMPSPAAPEPESSPATPDLTEMQIRLLKKLKSNHNSPLSMPEPSLSLPEPTDALGAKDIAATIAKPSENVNAADEARLPKPPAIILPKLANEQMFTGLVEQAAEPFPIDELEERINALEKKVKGTLNERTDEKKIAVTTDHVSCSVFAPSHAPPLASLMVQVFLHVEADLIKVRELAQEVDQAAEKRLGTARLKTRIVREAIIDIELEGHGLDVDENIQSLIWRGEAEAVNFIITLPSEVKRKDYFPVARLFIDGIPIGHIKFKLSAIPEQVAEPAGLISSDDGTRSTPQGIEQHTYKRAFISYSRKNFEIVSHFNEGLLNGGYETFFDLESLAAGERWSDAIEKAIDVSDVFFLCWTTDAKNSKWVDKEVLYAITQQRQMTHKQPTIIPIAFETPLPTPPQFLSQLHFNSRHQLIRAGMSVSQG